jgi:hypothetical protein
MIDKSLLLFTLHLFKIMDYNLIGNTGEVCINKVALSERERERDRERES